MRLAGEGEQSGLRPLLDVPKDRLPREEAVLTPHETHEIPQEDGTGTVIGSTLNVANCAIGAGVLAFPFAFKCAGLLLGPILVIILSLFMGAALHVLAATAKDCGSRTYQETLKFGLPDKLGHACEWILESTVYVYVLGCGVAFLSVVSDQISPIIDGHGPLANRSVLISSLSLTVAFPLCLIRNINAFVLSSIFAIVSILYMSIIVMYYGISLGPSYFNPTGTLHLINPDTAQIFKAIPIICYAFNCHLAYTPIFNELKARDADGSPYRTVRNMDRVAVGAYVICATLYIACGICGCMLFGDRLSDGGDILAQLPGGGDESGQPCRNPDGSDNVLAQTGCVATCPPDHPACPYDVHVARLSVAIAVLSLYPKLQWVARTCIDDLLVNHGVFEEVKDEGGARVIPDRRFYLETVFYVVVTTLVACVVPQISVVMDFIGSTLAGLQVFVFPGLLWWKLKAREAAEKGLCKTSEFPMPLYTHFNIVLAVFMAAAYYATL